MGWRYLLALLIAEFVICLTVVIIRHWNYGVMMQLTIGGVSGIIYAILYGSSSYLMDFAQERWDLFLKIMVVIFVIPNVIINVFIVKTYCEMFERVIMKKKISDLFCLMKFGLSF